MTEWRTWRSTPTAWKLWRDIPTDGLISRLSIRHMAMRGGFKSSTRWGHFDRYKDWRTVGGEVRKKILSWDIAPSEDYFNELFRVSKEQIIWGGNYFGLPPTRCFLVWRKTNIPEHFTMAMAEYAWCSFNGNAKVLELPSMNIPGRFHPTQKPEQLYQWIYGLYAKPGFKILDTHLGSGSSRRAAWDFDLDFVGCEIDKVYFEKQEALFAEYVSQTRLEL